MIDILRDLTDGQREAVTHIEGPLLVIAGPGSGKTRVITRRIAYLIYCGIRPWNILAITFTNKAANEMRQRVDALVAERGVWVSTFHSFCARQLRRYGERLGYSRDFTIYDSDDTRRLLAAIMKDFELAGEDWKPAAVQSAISALKAQLNAPEEMAALADAGGEIYLKTLARLYAEYDRRLKASNCMDFDDLLMQMARLLSSQEDARRQLERRHQFVLIDEFQDTNHTQYEIARLLTSSHGNICATGDPDQSIYGWRGAEIRNILDFERDFPATKLVFLDRNYRSTATILSAADAVVANNLSRKPRKLYTTNPEGERILLSFLPDGREEASLVARQAAENIASGTSPSDIAVFYRVNWLSRQIEEAFIDEGIAYQIVGGVEFYNRREVKDIVAYLRVAANPADETSLARIINVPSRYVGPKSIKTLYDWASEHTSGLSAAVDSPEARSLLHSPARLGLESLSAILKRIRKAAPRGARAAVEEALAASGYMKILEKSGKEEDTNRIDNLKELVNAAAQFDEQVEEESESAALMEFLEQAALVSDIDTWQDEQEKVTLMTMHAAKGLEFPVVFITGLEESILPHSRSSDNLDEIEEERRIFFVAMTRAKSRLYLSHAESRMAFGDFQMNLPSRFIREIPPHLLEISEQEAPAEIVAPARPPRRTERTSPAPQHSRPSPVRSEAEVPKAGTRVRHDAFGTGVIESVVAQGPWHKATIRFSRGGTRKLILEKAKLEIMNA